MNDDILVIIPCGGRKIWDKYPGYGPCRVRDAYIGPSFVVNREFAEACGTNWKILSAKFGYMSPDFIIPESYNVTFKKPPTNPVATAVLVTQIREQGLDRYRSVIGIGGREYLDRIRESFQVFRIPVFAPCAVLPIGKMLGCVKNLTGMVKRDPGTLSRLCQQI